LLDSYASQSAYGNYYGYDLLNVYGLSALLEHYGWKKVSPSPGNVREGYAVFGNAGDGPMSHAAVGVGNGIIDCHNAAFHHFSAGNIFMHGIDLLLAPP